MTVIVRVLGASDGSPTPHDERWVVDWDPHTAAGTLALTSTGDPTKARRFSTPIAVLIEWKTVSCLQPIRPWDSQPNRPLTGLSITFDRYPLSTPAADPGFPQPGRACPPMTGEGEPCPPPPSAGGQARPPRPRAPRPRKKRRPAHGT